VSYVPPQEAATGFAESNKTIYLYRYTNKHVGIFMRTSIPFLLKTSTEEFISDF
jgi:hypothetical protein